jgi:branched-chain amino acid aminotransferase
MQIPVEQVTNSKLENFDFSNVAFGKNFSDHMLIAEYKDGFWNSVKIQPFQPLELSPATNVFHYAQSIFEGLKAFKTIDGAVALFRPEDNWRRMNDSAERIAMPAIPKEIFLEGMYQLLRLDKGWVPSEEGTALYIRPFMIGSEPFIGVKISDRYLFIIITGPVGAYFSEPINVYASVQDARAVKGVGKAKFAGNYAASLYPAAKAREKGYKDVLWLDSEQHRYIQEVGAMNIFFVIDGKIITPELDGGFLPGITRESIIQVAKDKGYPVEERKISIDELVASHKRGTLTEMFGTGTAAVVTFCKGFGYGDEDFPLSVEEYTIAPKLKQALTDIQKGIAEDTHGWVVRI